ncbi:unnamed protein product [Sympodiomycopsis kandeliae]
MSFTPRASRIGTGANTPSSMALPMSSGQNTPADPPSQSQSNTTSVQVALRVRPLNPHDAANIPPRWQKSVISPLSTSSVQVDASTGPPVAGDERTAPSTTGPGIKRQAYTFDRVFGQADGQHDLYTVAHPLVGRFLEGYNVTILAYGQTSSGKSYTMGTATSDVDFESLVAGRTPDPQIGIIPRAVSEIFTTMRQNQQKNSGVRYSAKASFIEIYNEELIDLLADATEPDARPLVQIREDKAGHIFWSGLREPKVNTVTDVMNYLLQGSAVRRTNETDMNAQSSRSHAIFSLTLTQQKWVGSGAPPPPSAAHNSALGLGGRSTPSGMRSTSTGLPRPSSMLPQSSRAQSPATPGRTSISGLRPGSVTGSYGRSASPMFGAGGASADTTMSASADGNWVTVTSKFHFVDLAGSERLKRTAAQGERAKEGISINAGLHALGNVISALGDPAKAKRTTHIPYRDSKLTRLLQDSLGGNAHTLMIACVAPTEYNVGETVNTLQYANRARNIKNKAEKNEVEVGWDDLDHLQSTVLRLRKELGILKSGGKGQGDLASLQALDDKEILKWQGKFTEASQKITQLTAELTGLQQSMKGKGNSNEDFLAAAEPIIVEYEKTLDAREGQLNLMKAALDHSEDIINESEARIADQEERIINAEQQLESRESTIVELQSRLAKVQDRESTAEAYTRDLESRLAAHTTSSENTSEESAELKKDIARLKEDEATRETYIKSLEERLTKADETVVSLTAHVERLEKDVERRDESHRELQQRLEMLDNGEQSKALAEDYSRSEQSNLELRAELDALRAEKDSVVKERGRLNDSVASHELNRGTLEDKIRDLESALAASSLAGPTARGSTRNGYHPTSDEIAEKADRDVDDALEKGESSEAAAVRQEQLSALEKELESLRIEVAAARESEGHAKTQVEALNSKYQDTLNEMHALNLQLSEAKLMGSARNTDAFPSAREVDGEAEEELEEMAPSTAKENERTPKPSLTINRRGSFQYSPYRSKAAENDDDSPDSPARSSQLQPQSRLVRRSSGSFFGYNPRQGGLDSPSRLPRPRSLSQSLSQELSQGLISTSGAGTNTTLSNQPTNSSNTRRGPRPLSLSGSITLPQSPMVSQPTTPLSSSMTNNFMSPGGRASEGGSSTIYDRRVATLEKGILSLQEALKKRDEEIAMLEKSLRDSDNGGVKQESGTLAVPDVSVTNGNYAASPASGMSRSATSESAYSTPDAVTPSMEDLPVFERSQPESSNSLSPTELASIKRLLSEHRNEESSGDKDAELAEDPQSDRRLVELIRSMARKEEAHREESGDLSAQLQSEKQRVEAAERLAHEQQEEIATLKAQLTQAETTDTSNSSEMNTPKPPFAASGQDGLVSEADHGLITRELEDLRVTLSQTQSKLSAREEAFEKQLQRIRDEQARDLSAGNGDPEMTSKDREHTESLAHLVAEHQTAMEMTIAEHQSAVEQLIADHSEALSLRDTTHSDAVAELQRTHKDALSRSLAEREADLADMQREFLAELNAVKDEHSRTLASQLAEKDDLHGQAVADHAKELEQAKTTHLKDLDTLRASHVEELSRLRDEHEKTTSNLREEHEGILSKHKAEAAAAAASALAASAATAAAMNGGDDKAVESDRDNVQQQHQAALAALQERANSDRQQALADAHTAYTNERQRMKDEHEARVADLRSDHQREMDALSRRLSTFRDVHGDMVDVDTLRLELSETSDALVTLEDALTNVTAERDELVTELKKLQNGHGSGSGSGHSGGHEQEHNSLRKEIESHKITLANLKTELQRSKNEIQHLGEERGKQDHQIRELQERLERGGGLGRAGSRDSYGFSASDEANSGTQHGNNGISGGSGFRNSKGSQPPPTPPPNMPPPPTPQRNSTTGGNSTIGARTSLSSLMSRSDSPGPGATTSGGGALTRSSSATSMHTSSPSLNGIANQDAKRLLADQSEELKNLAKQLAHCEADLQANIDLVATLEAALNDSERNLRKSRVQLGEVSRERDRYSSQSDDLRQQLQSAQKEVESVRNSVMLEKQDFEQRIRTERAAKEKAARDLEARMEEINRKKSSKLFCM